MIKGLAHVCISAKDLAATERFYVTGLGLKKGFDFIRNGQIIGFYLELGRLGFIEVFKRDEVDAKANGPIQHLCIEVDDIDRLVQQLTEHGYEATPKNARSRSKLAELDDRSQWRPDRISPVHRTQFSNDWTELLAEIEVTAVRVGRRKPAAPE